jgi:hypothetical protein
MKSTGLLVGLLWAGHLLAQEPAAPVSRYVIVLDQTPAKK